MKIIKYFKELLQVLKSIDKRLENLEKCIQKNYKSQGDPYSLSTKHWNS